MVTKEICMHCSMTKTFLNQKTKLGEIYPQNDKGDNR